MSGPRYWYAYSKQREEWLVADQGRINYPVNWRGTAFLVFALVAPFLLLVALLPWLVTLSTELATLLGVGGLITWTVVGILVMRAKTDPELSIQDYRARAKSPEE